MNEPSSTHPLQILLVEDSVDDAELIEIALRRADLAFTIARVEEEGPFLAQLDARRPELILCDYHLPRFSADRVFDLLEARGLPVPVLMVSRHISEEEREAVLARGARGVVAKNALPELARAIMSVLVRAGR